MDPIRHGGAAPAAVLASPRTSRAAPGAVEGLADGEEPAAVSRPARGAAHADLETIFRRDYERVVGVAARVLGSRDEAEDVAQEVFLSFGRSTVPVRDAGGWLTVAAAHTALNLLRSGRRRTAREEAIGGEPTVV